MTKRALNKRVCKDCRAGGNPRPASFPGPRCYTHHKKFEADKKVRNRERRVAAIYSLPPEVYKALLDACPKNDKGTPMCMTCTKYKARAVDHDHKCCLGKTSCGRCVRGLLCGNCNTILGRQRDDAEVFFRMGGYLLDPPAQRIIAELALKEGA